MLRSTAIALVAATVVTFAWVRDAQACSCMPVKPPAESAEEADAVFEGVVSTPTNEGSRNFYPVEVSRVFKGSVEPKVTIRTADNSAACGRRFEPGQSYLIYAYATDDGGWGDGLCTRTRPSAEAEEDFAVLGPGQAPVSSDEPEIGDEPETPAESPRIDQPTQPSPPPASPSKRGCTVDRPAGATTLLGLVIAAAARPRRRRRS